MKLRSFSIGCVCCGVVAGIVMAVTVTAAPSASADLCRDTVQRELAKEERLFRSVLFGQKKAAEAVVGEVRFDRDGRSWIKAARNEWRSAAQGLEDEKRTDAAMDEQMESPSRRGLVETRGVLTSDLVPLFVQSFRALSCRTALVCRTAERSVSMESDDPIVVAIPGCLSEERKPYATCALVQAKQNILMNASDVYEHCHTLQAGLLDQEETVLRMTVEYDAAVRSLLQLSGNLDAFLQNIRFPVTGTLQDVLGLVGTLGRTPCFAASCEPTR